MGKKIVILNGSPRPEGNTAALVAAFTRGAESAGNTVTVFDLDSMSIHGCKGCFGGGMNREHPCVQRDDMDKIYPAYAEADVLVLASPLYYWRFSGQLLCAFDRLFAVAEGQPDGRTRMDCALLMAAGGYDFEDCQSYYQRMTARLGWRNLGAVLCGGVTDPGDIAGRRELSDAEALGASIAVQPFALTRETTMGEMLKHDMGIANILMQSGMHCVGCPSSVNETLAEACAVHGLDTDTVFKAIQDYLS